MKRTLKLSAVVLISVLALTACSKIELKDGKAVIAKTEKETITAEQLFEKMKEKYALNVMLDMIDEKLLSSIYKDKDAEKTYSDNQYEQMNYYYESYMKEQYSSFVDFINQSYGFKDEVELRNYFSLAYKREEATKDYAKSVITDKEIQKYYDEKTIGDMKASHILIQADYPESASDEEKTKAKEKAKKEALDVIKLLNEGAKFEDLAKKYSKDSSASKGGDLGWFGQGKMTKPFEDAVIKLATNKYTTEPVETEFGYHIIMKTGAKAKDKLSALRNDIISTLATEKQSSDKDIQAKAMISVRKKYGIKINDTMLSKQYKTYVSKIEN